MKTQMLKFSNGWHIRYQEGDTIVEVLLCMAIVSLALGGAFVATHKSQLGVRNSQEHAEVVQLMQSQIEQLRGDNSDAAIYSPGTFCMYNGTETTGANCMQNGSGQSGKPDSRYGITITCANPNCPDATTNGYMYTVAASWDQVDGNGKATEQLVYRLYK